MYFILLVMVRRRGGGAVDVRVEVVMRKRKAKGAFQNAAI